MLRQAHRERVRKQKIRTYEVHEEGKKMKRWSDFKKPETFNEAVEWLNFATEHGNDVVWSIQYYGFGEHFTFWRGDGTFDDFNIDKGTGISWKKMQEIIIESAQSLYTIQKTGERIHDEWGRKR